MMNPQLTELAKTVMRHAEKRGADQAAVVASKNRIIDLSHRDDKLETIRESSAASISLSVYLKGRYSTHQTSDLRPKALEKFVASAVDMTSYLTPDPHRRLADPKLYEGRSKADLHDYDSGYPQVSTDRRKAIAEETAKAGRTVKGPIVSVASNYSDRHMESVRLHSNGFEDGNRSTRFYVSGQTTVDDDGKKPVGSHYASARRLGDLPGLTGIGQTGTKRAVSRIGQVKLSSGSYNVVVENRIAGYLLMYFGQALRGDALYQKRSFLLGKKGEKIGNERFDLRDDPLLVGGLGSRRYDEDGISARPRTLVNKGMLSEYLIDVYYGAKLGMTPSGGGVSNVTLTPGDRSPEALIADVQDGIYMTGMIGGNADSNTGDFSHGIVGFEIKGGKIGRPVGEMNITGSHAQLWHQLAAVGNDPFLYGRLRMPTLVLENVSVSGA